MEISATLDSIYSLIISYHVVCFSMQPQQPLQFQEKDIRKAGVGGAYIFSDGSLLESGNVGGGAFIVGSRGAEVEVESGIGHVATVWDGEVAGMEDTAGKECSHTRRLEGSHCGSQKGRQNRKGEIQTPAEDG